MRRIYLIIIVIGLSVNAKANQLKDTAKGITFFTNLNWNQVLAKAKMEGKYIFVDCYASWCLPCKKMDLEVFRLEGVGKLFNSKFISVKYQMDSTLKDDPHIKNLYKDANIIKKTYQINGYPTLLFFTPDGRILNKSEGMLDAQSLILFGKEILNPEKNFYLVLDQFKKGKRDLIQMAWLARYSIRLLNDSSLSEDIKKEYLKTLKGKTLITKSNIEFLGEFFSRNSKDTGFALFYQNSDSINNVMGDDIYAQSIVHSIIYREIVYPAIKYNETDTIMPNWDSLALIIKNKYNQYYAERMVLSTKVVWSKKNKRWSEFTKYLVNYMEKYCPKKSPLLCLVLNNNAWSIFQYSNNPEELQKALQWSAQALLLNPSSTYFDTYANILYKLNRKDEALIWQEIAAKQQPNHNTFQQTLDAMKKGRPTWLLLDEKSDQIDQKQ